MKIRMSILLLLAMLVMSFNSSAQTVISAGDTWTYDDTDTDLGTTWREAAYGDLSKGPSPAHFGYGTITGIVNATTVTANLACYYFRKDFVYNKTGSETGFELEIMYDDGAAIYINGAEVHRTALMPTAYPTEVLFTDECTGFSTEGAWDSIILSVDDLADGANTIAVEVHNDSPASSDIGFDLRLTALTGGVDYAKHIRWGSSDSPLDGLTVTWRSVGSADKIKWGYTTDLLQGEFTASTHAGYEENFHDYNFGTVTPASIIYYQIWDSANSEYGNIKQFNTAPAETDPYTILAMGDSRTNAASWTSVANAANIHDAAAVVFTSDIVNDGSVFSDWNAWFNAGESFIADKLIYHSTGNHEYYGNGEDIYPNIYVLPENNPESSELYYSFEYANAVIICVNSETPTNSTMLTWLDNTLAANVSKTWKIVFFHRPFYSTGTHGGEMDSYLDAWWTKFDTYGVDLIFNGHDHIYERSVPINNGSAVAEYGSEPGQGRCQIITGGAGAPLYAAGNDWFVDNNVENKLHYVKMDVDGVNMTVNVYDNSQSVIDQFVLAKSFDGVAVTSPISDKILAPSGTEDIDLSAVFTDAEGDPLTFTVESNSDPSRATGNIAGNILTITAGSTEYNGSTTMVIKGEDVAHAESANDTFIVNIEGNEWDGASITPLDVNIIVPVDQTDSDIVTITAGIPPVLNFIGGINFISKKLSYTNDTFVPNPNIDRSQAESHESGIPFEKATAPKAAWDQQFAYDVSTSSGVSGLAGCESDGNFIYSTSWSSADLAKFGMDGTYIETFTIAGVTGLRDLAYDGQYFYGGAAANDIYEMDFTSKTLVSTITSPVAVRAIAYDDANDGFWVNNWAEDMTLVGRDGSTIDTMTGIPSCYGAAYDNWSAGGPYLWINKGTDAASGATATLEQFNIATGATTGFIFEISAFEVAGGSFVQPNIILGTVTIVSLAQGEALYGYELCASETWLTLSNGSGAVTTGATHDVTLNFDATGFTNGTTKTATLTFMDEHGNEYSNPVNVTMNVGAVTNPDITLSAAIINTTAAPEGTDTDSFDVGNIGDADLDYTITHEYTAKKATINVETNDFESGLLYTNSGSQSWAIASELTVSCAKAVGGGVPLSDAVLTSGSFDGTICTSLSLDFDQIISVNSSNGPSFIVEYYNGSAWVEIYNGVVSTTASQSLPLPVLTANMQIRFTGNLSTKGAVDTWSIDNIVVSGPEVFTYTWLSFTSPLTGTVIPTGSTTINLTCDAAGLLEGTYTANINVGSNDPDENPKVLPVSFVVSGGVVIPAVPINIVTSISGTDLVIDWDVSADAIGYDIYSSDDPYGTFGFVTNVGTNQYTVATDQAKLFYYIVAKNATKK
ncbi:MAG: hypothetical protein GQ534_12145 [Candidatus Delongbacteria bacterium]|nr:hypothetical protein [Candidatus Delongbacteria bacterium]